MVMNFRVPYNTKNFTSSKEQLAFQDGLHSITSITWLHVQ